MIGEKAMSAKGDLDKISKRIDARNIETVMLTQSHENKDLYSSSELERGELITIDEARERFSDKHLVIFEWSVVA
jgi:hypothetical protein